MSLQNGAGQGHKFVATGEPDRDDFDPEAGLGLVRDQRYDEAAAYFEQHLGANALAWYGLAMARFRKDPKNLTAEKTAGIIPLFEEAIARDPAFPDALFWCGIARRLLAGFQLGKLARDPAKRTAGGLDEAEANLYQAEGYVRKAAEADPGFASFVEPELESIREFRESAGNLRKLL